jgi:hypothetical protein
MSDYKVTVQVDMKKGASVYNEAAKFRKIFTDNKLNIVNEEHTNNSIVFTIKERG